MYLSDFDRAVADEDLGAVEKYFYSVDKQKKIEGLKGPFFKSPTCGSLKLKYKIFKFLVDNLDNFPPNIIGFCLHSHNSSLKTLSVYKVQYLLKHDKFSPPFTDIHQIGFEIERICRRHEPDSRFWRKIKSLLDSYLYRLDGPIYTQNIIN